MSRPILIFLAVLIVGALERAGLLEPSQNSENVQLVTEVLTWAVTGLVAIYAIWHETHKRPVVIDNNNIQVTVGEKKKFLQTVLNWIKEHRLVEVKQQQQ